MHLEVAQACMIVGNLSRLVSGVWFLVSRLPTLLLPGLPLNRTWTWQQQSPWLFMLNETISVDGPHLHTVEAGSHANLGCRGKFGRQGSDLLLQA